MYPVIRLIKERYQHGARPLGLFEPHVSTHICWPWDLDPWMELNNGRTLTLYDLGRIPLMIRTGFIAAIRARGWGMTVAGSHVRYRQRIRMFQRFEMHSRVVGWDHRFVYLDQSMWRNGVALNNLLVRIAATQPSGILPPAQLMAQMGCTDLEGPALPEWVQAWIAADAQRPWPPQISA
ncbi:acyl-CoA thioesterase [Pararhodobacter sp.]|uniref:acyl-CoA thioesterase n=1 Tax=Pararhodobacter sp. TaxID=2127056 RepID=UPI002AFE229C|nr:acyl-CoA thioesterase [Pararhodobacter sp.]